jgi:hypothetical protein
MPTFAPTEVPLSEAIAALGAFAKPTESKSAMLVERPAAAPQRIPRDGAHILSRPSTTQRLLERFRSSRVLVEPKE